MFRIFTFLRFFREDTHILISEKSPVDRNDPEGAKTAIGLDLPEGFSDKAKKCWDYFDDTAAIYLYRGKLVLTDESLELTDAGDGTRGNPWKGPRWTGKSWKSLERFLEACYDDLREDELI